MNITAFLIAMLPIILSPGASFTLAVNNAINGGLKGVNKVIIGTFLGLYTHALLAGLGVTKILSLYPSMLVGLEVIGVAYLTYLGIMLIRGGLRAKAELPLKEDGVTVMQAYLANVLNVKAVLMYLVVVPLFVGNPATVFNYLFLATLNGIIMALWLTLIATVMIKSSQRIDVLLMKRVINIGGGLILIAMTFIGYLRNLGNSH